MNEFWPPPAPPLQADFEKAKEEAKPALEAAVTKEQGEDLPPKPKMPAPKLVLTPPGMKPSPPMNIAQQERMERRMERIQKKQEQQKQEKTRDDFRRAAGREM